MTDAEMRHIALMLNEERQRGGVRGCPHVVIEIDTSPKDPRRFECVLCRDGVMVPREWAHWATA